MASGLTSNLIISGVGLVFLAAGLYAMNRGRIERNRTDAITSMETTSIQSMQDGPVEITGTAAPVEDTGTFASPLSETEALAATVDVEEWNSSGRGGNWQTGHHQEPTVPMVVNDGTGAVRVEVPTDGMVNLDRNRTTVESGDEPPDHIRRYVENEPELEIPTRHGVGPVSIGEPRRYAEGVLEPGEEVYVLGRARPAPTGDGGIGYVVDEPTASGEFILSDKSEEELVQEGRVGGLIDLAIGGLFALVGVGVTLIPWIPA